MNPTLKDWLIANLLFYGILGVICFVLWLWLRPFTLSQIAKENRRIHEDYERRQAIAEMELEKRRQAIAEEELKKRRQ